MSHGQITFLVHKGKDYTVRKYLASWGRALAGRVRVRNYPDLRATGGSVGKRINQTFNSWLTGTLRDPGPVTGVAALYVFTDLDRLDPAELESAMALRARLEEHPDTVAIWNHPSKCLGRFDLLSSLYESGRNRFAVYRASSQAVPRRWPVFVKNEDDHGGQSGLLHTPEELSRELEALTRRGEDLSNRLIIEFCDTADEHGMMRKYGAFRLGEEILARQIHFSRQWLIRFPDICAPETAAEELAYVESNPHQEQVRQAFERAGIEYGRIDYSLAEGRIQVWEINTNPMILIPSDRRDPVRFQAHDAFGNRFNAVMTALLEKLRRDADSQVRNCR